jgi:integrase/recombinase XerD
VSLNPTQALAPVTLALNELDELDDHLVRSWLRSHRSSHTQDAYARDVARFRAFIQKPLGAIGIDDLHDYADSLSGETSSRARRLAAVKSLLSHGHRTEVLRLDVGAQLKLPRREDRLAERILPRDDVRDLLRLEPDPRNRALLRLAYYAALRVSELVSLQWRHFQPRVDGGQVSVFGKGEKTRVILLPSSVWREVNGLRHGAPADAYVFPGRDASRPISGRTAERIVQRAAKRVNTETIKDKHISIHTLRHCHASHALRYGKAPIDLVAATLGHTNVATTSKYLHASPDDSSARYLDGDR